MTFEVLSSSAPCALACLAWLLSHSSACLLGALLAPTKTRAGKLHYIVCVVWAEPDKKSKLAAAASVVVTIGELSLMVVGTEFKPLFENLQNTYAHPHTRGPYPGRIRYELYITIATPRPPSKNFVSSIMCNLGFGKRC